MNRLKPVIFIIFIVSVCFAEKVKTVVDCSEAVKAFREAAAERDSVKCYTDSATSRNIIVESMAQAQKFYSEAFNQLQSSFSYFLTYISIAVALIGLALMVGTILSHSKIKNDSNNYDKRFSGLENDLKGQKTTLTQDIETLKSERNNLFKEIGSVYFSLAVTHSNPKDSKDWKLHFAYLSQYYDFLIANRIELTDRDMENLKLLGEFSEHYMKITMSIVDWSLWEQLQKYSHMLYKFEKYCRETNKQKHLAEVMAASKEFNNVFDAIQRNIPVTEEPLHPNPHYPASAFFTAIKSSNNNPNKETSK